MKNKRIYTYVSKRRDRGITLIALIITIVVLIILSAATIKTVYDMDIVKLSTKSIEKQGVEIAREKLTIRLAEMKGEYAGAGKKLKLSDLVELNKEVYNNIFAEITNKDENGQEIDEKVVIYSEEGEKDYAKVSANGYVFKVDEDLKIRYINDKIDVKPIGPNPKEDLEKDYDYEGEEDDNELAGDKIVLDTDLVWDANAGKMFLSTIPSGWTGVYTEADLSNMKNNLAGKYILMNDLTLASAWTPIGSESEEFKGYFNGNGYTISNMKINSSNGYAGMFARTSGGASITNLTLKDYSITGTGSYIGSLVRIQ